MCVGGRGGGWGGVGVGGGQVGGWVGGGSRQLTPEGGGDGGLT